MATLVTNAFTEYVLSEPEQEAGSIFNTLQQQVIQNHIAAAAVKKLNIVYDPANHADYGMQIAYQQGIIDMLTVLLLTSEEVSTTVVKRASNQQ